MGVAYFEVIQWWWEVIKWWGCSLMWGKMKKRVKFVDDKNNGRK